MLSRRLSVLVVLLLAGFIALFAGNASTVEAQADPTPTPGAPTPPVTPLPVPEITFESWTLVEIAPFIRDGLSRPYVAFINENDSQTVTNLSTAQPTTDLATLYFADPLNRDNLYPIAEFDAEALEAIHLAPNGGAAAYWLNNQAGTGRGLWVLDVSLGISYRILNTDQRIQRGLTNTPAFSPDGRRLAVVLETGYNLDIFVFDLDAEINPWAGLVRDGSFNFWPSFSPDGRYLSFVSDRAICPSWIPGDPDACNPNLQPTPTSGHVYVLELATGIITQVSETITFEPPYWINSDQIAFSTGDPFDLLNPQRNLWIARVPQMTSQPVRLPNDDGTVYVRESWSSGGDRVIFQDAGDENRIVVMSASGQQLDVVNQVTFARFALSADWAPSGDRISLGGTSGQCPYGMRVMRDSDYSMVATGNVPSNVCNPVYAADGSFIAYTGINNDRSSLDGRRDLYVSSPDGFNALNLTISLRGQMNFLAWVGPGN